MKTFRSWNNGVVNFTIAPESPCPCGSQRRLSQCCGADSRLHKRPAATAPPPPQTGERIEGCYAACLGDCGSMLSREHYISESLLRHLNRNKDLTIGGLSWMGGETKVLPPDALASKMLCDRHNSALASLDDIAVHLFRAFDEEGAIGSSEQRLYLFSGHDLERWLLKVLCGMASAKSLSLDVERDLSIPQSWIDILFGDRVLSDGQGLYVCNAVGHQFDGPRGVTIQAITGRAGITGIGLSICGYELVLSMSGFGGRMFDGRRFVYRPMEFYTTAQDFEKSVVFSWVGEADQGTIHCRIDRP